MTPPSRPDARLTILEARAYLKHTHGIRISRATFWREFMSNATEITTMWCGVLAQRGPTIAWTFAVASVDRMAVAYLARRLTVPPTSDPLSSAVTRFGERRPAKKRPPAEPT